MFGKNNWVHWIFPCGSSWLFYKGKGCDHGLSRAEEEKELVGLRNRSLHQGKAVSLKEGDRALSCAKEALVSRILPSQEDLETHRLSAEKLREFVNTSFYWPEVPGPAIFFDQLGQHWPQVKDQKLAPTPPSLSIVTQGLERRAMFRKEKLAERFCLYPRSSFKYEPQAETKASEAEVADQALRPGPHWKEGL